MYFLLHTIVTLLSILPLKLNHALGTFIGLSLWYTRANIRRVIETNLYYCFPELSDAERKTLAKATLIESGKTITETAFVWKANTRRVLNSIQRITGFEPILAHAANKEPVILITPHISCWEMTSLYIATKAPLSCLYQPSRKAPEINTFIQTCRERTGATLVPTTAQGIIGLMKCLKKGGIVGILPDQEPTFDSGITSTFFGRPALSMTLVSKLLSRTHAKLYVCHAERLPHAQGYALSFTAVTSDKVYDPDILTSVTAINQQVEQLVRTLPTQYQWGYKRFKRVGQQPNIYDRPLDPRTSR